MVASTCIPATAPMDTTICWAAVATPRCSGSTELAAVVISDGDDAPRPSPESSSATTTRTTDSCDAATANTPIDATTSTVPVIAARRSPTRTATYPDTGDDRLNDN